MTKYCKIKLSKVRGGSSTKFIYPQNYDETQHEILIYQNEGLDTEYALSKVSDNFVFDGTDYIEETLTSAQTLIDTWIDSNKDITSVPQDYLDDNPSATLTDYKTFLKNNIKSNL